MPDVQSLAAKYAAMQHDAVIRADDAALRRHIADTLRRCLPAAVVTYGMVEQCFYAVNDLPGRNDPMHTGAIHAWAGEYLLHSAAEEGTLRRLRASAKRLLPSDRPADRDDIRLVTLDALYQPGMLPAGTHLAFLKHRLGLNGCPRLSCEEIAIRMHQPLTRVHELESAILTILTNTGGPHA